MKLQFSETGVDRRDPQPINPMWIVALICIGLIIGSFVL